MIWKRPSATRSAADSRLAPVGGKAFLSVWWNSAGFVRLGLFAFCCILLLVAAQFYESKWVGMLSALPLPGLFAVATLSTISSDKEFGIMRQTVLWGPVTVIAFNWAFAEAFARLHATAWSGLPLLVLFLGVDAALIFWSVPRLAQTLDRHGA
jgi:hypothetical protein